MLGRRIVDRVESGRGPVDGLGWLDVDTEFEPTKTTRQRRGHASRARVSGYEIRHGRIDRVGPEAGWIHLDDAYGTDVEGSRSGDGGVLGTSLHGLFEEDAFRSAFLQEVAQRRAKRFVSAGVSFAAARRTQWDRLADLLEAHLDLEALESLIGEGRAR